MWCICYHDFLHFLQIMSAIGLHQLLTHIIAYDSSNSLFYIVSFFCLKVGKGTWHSIMCMRKCVQRKMSLYHVYVWRCPKENDTLSCNMSEGVRRKMTLYHIYVRKCAKEDVILRCIHGRYAKEDDTKIKIQIL